MSKGHGRLERAILERLAERASERRPDDRWVAVAEVADNRSARESARRAMKRLADEGYAEVGQVPLHDPRDGRTRSHLCARITDAGLQLLLDRDRTG